MSEWDDTEEYTYPRKWSEEEMDERFADLYTQIMDEVKELFFQILIQPTSPVRLHQNFLPIINMK